MKNLIIKTGIIFLMLFGLQGCYTILWTPDKKISSEYESSSYYSGYASDFYDVPWWINVPVIVAYPYAPGGDKPGTKFRNDKSDNDSRELRDNNGERNPHVYRTPPPTINTPGSTTPPSGSEKSNNSGSTVRTESSGSSSSGSNTNRSSDTRNNSGSRNSGNGRR